jgi:hypothetical protein
VFIISGRTRTFLEKWFNNLSVNLVDSRDTVPLLNSLTKF